MITNLYFISGPRNEEVRNAYKLLYSVVEKFVNQSAYSHINITRLFAALVEKAPMCKG